MTNKSNKYRIVLTFEDDDLENYDRVVALETKLEKELVSGKVDGHDVGGGSVNIFIDSSGSKICFEEAMQIIKDMCQSGGRSCFIALTNKKNQ